MQLLPFTAARAPAFRAINAASIEAMFALEPHDRAVLDDPRGHILDRGGVILFAGMPEGDPVGTGALMPTAPGCVELTRMGVTDAARGQGVGALPLHGLIAAAADLPGLELLYLLTSRRCAAAIRLYERAGFVHDAAVMARFGGGYARCDVAMRWPADRVD